MVSGEHFWINIYLLLPSHSTGKLKIEQWAGKLKMEQSAST